MFLEAFLRLFIQWLLATPRHFGTLRGKEKSVGPKMTIAACATAWLGGEHLGSKLRCKESYDTAPQHNPTRPSARSFRADGSVDETDLVIFWSVILSGSMRGQTVSTPKHFENLFDDLGVESFNKSSLFSIFRRDIQQYV